MNVQKTNPVADIGARLRQARDDAGFSRARLGQITGIGPRVIEKIETGTQEPSASRVRKLCEALNIEMAGLLGMDKAPTRPAPVPASVEIETVNPADLAADMLDKLDTMREEGFGETPRAAMAAVKEIKQVLETLDAPELLALAKERGLAANDLSDTGSIFSLFESDPCEGHAYCGSVEDRIIDTAILGADLWSIEVKRLHKVADGLVDLGQLKEPGFFDGWGEHKTLAPQLRPLLWQMATAGVSSGLSEAKPGR